MQLPSSKGVSSLLSTMIYVSLAAGAVTTIYLFSAPITQNLGDSGVVNSMVESMNTMEDTVLTVAEAGKGSQQPLNIGFRKGTLNFDAVDDRIIFSIDTAANIISAGTAQQFGNIEMSSGSDVDVEQITHDSTDCWQMTNKHIQTCIKIVPETPDKLLLYNAFDGSGQTVFDGSKHGNDGTRGTSDDRESSDPQRTGQCIIGDCFSFDGNDDFYTTDWNTSLGTQGNMTISMWVRPESNGPTPYLQKGNSTHTTFQTYVTDTGTWQFENANGIVSADQTIEDGSWQHLTVRRNQTHVTFYINGLEKNTEPLADTLHVPTSVTVGRNSAGNYGTGMIDELAIYNTTLPVEEIKERFNTNVFDKSYYNTSELIVQYRNIDTGLSVEDPEVKAKINGNLANANGFGTTTVKEIGKRLTRGQVTASMKTAEGISYNLVLTVLSGSDFLHAKIESR